MILRLEVGAKTLLKNMVHRIENSAQGICVYSSAAEAEGLLWVGTVEGRWSDWHGAASLSRGLASRVWL